MKTSSVYSFIAATAMFLVVVSANASLITNDSDPLLWDASVIDFSEVPIGSLDPVIGGVRFVGELAQLETSDYGFFFHPFDNRPILSNSTFSTDGTSFDIFLILPSRLWVSMLTESTRR